MINPRVDISQRTPLQTTFQTKETEIDAKTFSREAANQITKNTNIF